jgi:hypothetical protein
MLSEMSSRTLTEWMAYYSIEPWGDELVDMHLANVTSILANQNRAKNSKAMKPDDFRLWKKVKKAFDPHEFYESLKGMFRGSG